MVHLLDARHPPTSLDQELLAWLDEAKAPTVLVANKFDKLKASQHEKAIKAIRNGLDLDEEALVIPFSSVTKEGVRELWRVIEDSMGNRRDGH